MCGFAGFLNSAPSAGADELLTVVKSMADTLFHRGPDDAGEWVDAEAGIALGFRRLAILDLSPQGHQPMVSTSGRFVVVYNGEIYNHLKIRKELEGIGEAHPWRGHSDTETILAAIEAWGLVPAVRRFIGMFAFALWDRRERSLHLVRDRLGIKPLYYGTAGETFLFGSELKALRAHPDFKPEVDRSALSNYLQYMYVPAPRSIYVGIQKLMPGSILTIDAPTAEDSRVNPFWSVGEAIRAGTANPFSGSEREAVEQLDTLLRDAVGIRMIADVPLGAFLSGGVDSSTIVAMMQSQSTSPVKTFSIGFRESGYDEATQARAVAEHLKTDHTELYVTPEDAMAVIPRLPELYDEPFADSSQIPTFLVSQLARRYVTVSLSGDGGDELFGGYNRHFWTDTLMSRIRWAPGIVRGVLSGAVTGITPDRWDRFFDRFSGVLPSRLKQVQPGDKMHRLAKLMIAESADDVYRALVSAWDDPSNTVIGDGATTRANAGTQALSVPLSDTEKMMYLDTTGYLPDDILAKVDRASMGVSLEARVPILDHRVVEYAWTLPPGMKITGQQGKWILRQVLDAYVPRELIERPKMGFAVPIGRWLKGPLRDWAEVLLDPKRLERDGFFRTDLIRKAWTDHLSGRRNNQNALWAILMFQSWADVNHLT